MEIKEVFEPVLNFIRGLQKKEKEPASKQAAKDRLKLVLMQDRASVSPDFFEMMKKEIIDVIKKYIEIDEESLEVELTRGIDAGLEGPALYANIPIKNVKPVAPKSDELMENDDVELEMIEEVIPSNSPITEEEAEKMAESILDNLEKSAKNDSDEVDETIVVSDVLEETDNKEVGTIDEPVEFDKTAEDKGTVKKKSTTVKKTTTKKTTTKKATTTRKTASKKTTTTRKKKEE